MQAVGRVLQVVMLATVGLVAVYCNILRDSQLASFMARHGCSIFVAHFIQLTFAVISGFLTTAWWPGRNWVAGSYLLILVFFAPDRVSSCAMELLKLLAANILSPKPTSEPEIPRIHIHADRRSGQNDAINRDKRYLSRDIQVESDGQEVQEVPEEYQRPRDRYYIDAGTQHSKARPKVDEFILPDETKLDIKLECSKDEEEVEVVRDYPDYLSPLVEHRRIK